MACVSPPNKLLFLIASLPTPKPLESLSHSVSLLCVQWLQLEKGLKISVGFDKFKRDKAVDEGGSEKSDLTVGV